MSTLQAQTMQKSCDPSTVAKTPQRQSMLTSQLMSAFGGKADMGRILALNGLRRF
jgi:hypothetical protein